MLKTFDKIEYLPFGSLPLTGSPPQYAYGRFPEGGGRRVWGERVRLSSVECVYHGTLFVGRQKGGVDLAVLAQLLRQ